MILESFQLWKCRSTKVFAGIKYGGEEAWFRCWDTYQKTEVSSERQILLQALGATTDTWLLQRYLLLSLNQDLIKAQDIGTVVWSVASNENGRHLAWRHIKAYWPSIQTLFGNVSVAMSGLITDVVPFFNTDYDYREVGIRLILCAPMCDIHFQHHVLSQPLLCRVSLDSAFRSSMSCIDAGLI